MKAIKIIFMVIMLAIAMVAYINVFIGLYHATAFQAFCGIALMITNLIPIAIGLHRFNDWFDGNLKS